MNTLAASLAVTWNPAIPLPEATALALAFIAGGFWMALRSAPAGRPRIRHALLGLRSIGLVALALLWMNPGQWLDASDRAKRDWFVLLDRSGSMRAEHEPGMSRWSAGMRVAERLRKAAGPQGDVRVRTFATQLEDETTDLAPLVPDGAGSDLGRAISASLDQRGTPLAGIVLVSDGRQTSRAMLEELALRARGRGVPIHTVPVGGDWGSRDLSVVASPRQVTAFKGQPVKISARVGNRGLGPIKPSISLIGPDGSEIERKDVTLEEGAQKTVTFDLPAAADAGGDYTLRTVPWQGEHVPANNTDTVRLNVMTSRTRVLLLEGAPYWDSKFLAQMLRQQAAIEVLTIHRLNEERYFRVESTGAEPLQSPDDVFPANAEALGRYDLIVFGKGADGFLTPQRIAALQGFVRDQGGAVLFARGKSYPGRFPALESMEPVEWGESLSGGFRFVPLADAGANLFGAALPAADDRAWATLPLLEDVHVVARLKPFTRVLAEGAVEGRDARRPLLVARRYGRGTVVAVNADGLWRWDFRPEVREQGEVYQQFWVQLMQWCATFSEFRPGQEYAVRLRETSVEAGQAVRAVVAFRGPASPEPQPFLKLTRAGAAAGEAAATALPGAEGGREWAAVVAPAEPGRYEIRVADRNRPGKEEGEATLTVLAPPQEADDLRPDLNALSILSRDSGGQSFPLERVEDLATSLWQAENDATRGKPVWDPLWTHWWVAAALGIIFGAEWWLRRREGLL